MTTIRAKFIVDGVMTTQYGNEVTMSAVISGSEENSNFFRYTPSGSLKMGTVNPEVVKQFIPGQEFYLDFIPANETIS